MKVRTRFAPSPTGSLHLGGARTALFNWLFTRQHQGTFILRIEDTDVERSTQESAQGIIDSLSWLGLDWDEGPYFQSERMDIYWDHLARLREKGMIYPAFETKAVLEVMRQKALAEKRSFIYDRSALRMSPQEIQAKMDADEVFVWRFRVLDEGVTDVPEVLMAGGHYHVKNDTIGDFVITRPGTQAKPGMPLYNFVCAVDDALMGITHVIRGVEHLPNAAKQVLLYRALGYDIPQFVHLPLIMKHGKKMSKRDKEAQGKFPVSILERRDLGYLPEATINHLVLLGWSSEDAAEILLVDKLKKEFDLARLSRANANFDEDKYLFLNAHYLKNMENTILVEKITPFLLKAGLNVTAFTAEQLEKMVAMEKKRCKTLAEFPDSLAFFFTRPETYAEKGVQQCVKDMSTAVRILEAMAKGIDGITLVDIAHIDQALHQAVAELGLPFSQCGPIVRLALTGRTASPSLGEMIEVLGKQESIERLQAAKRFITSHHHTGVA